MARGKTFVIVTTKTTTTVAPRRCGGRASLSRARAPPALGAALAGVFRAALATAVSSPGKTPPPCREMDGAVAGDGAGAVAGEAAQDGAGEDTGDGGSEAEALTTMMRVTTRRSSRSRCSSRRWSRSSSKRSSPRWSWRRRRR